MEIKAIEGYDKIFGAPDDWDPTEGDCEGLPVRAVETDNGFFWVSEWNPTDEELSKLMGGSTIKLWIRGPGHPVVALTVGDIE